MEKQDFATIGNYLNEASRFSYSEKEMEENIETYWNEYQWSKANNKVSTILQGLMFYMVEDMDFQDYSDTENVVKTVEEMDKVLEDFLEEIK